MYVRRMLMLGAAAVLALAAAPAFAQSDMVTEIQNRGELKLLVTNNVPWCYKEPGNPEWIGYNIDLAKALAEEMKVKLTLVEADWATLIPSLQAKKADAIFAPMSLTTKRALVMFMVEPASYVGNFIIVRKGENRFKDYADFNNPSFKFAQQPNAGEVLARAYFPRAQVMIVRGDNPHVPRLEVANGRADASITDSFSAVNFVKENQEKAEIFKAPSLITTGIHFGVRKDDTHWAQVLNGFIQDYRNRGMLKTWGEKWGVQTSAQ